MRRYWNNELFLDFYKEKKGNQGIKAKGESERVFNNNYNISLFFNLLDFSRTCYDMQGCFSFTLHMSFFKVIFPQIFKWTWIWHYAHALISYSPTHSLHNIFWMEILVQIFLNTYMHNIFWMKISEKLLKILNKLVGASVSFFLLANFCLTSTWKIWFQPIQRIFYRQNGPNLDEKNSVVGPNAEYGWSSLKNIIGYWMAICWYASLVCWFLVGGLLVPTSVGWLFDFFFFITLGLGFSNFRD